MVMFSAGQGHTVYLRDNGHVVASGHNSCGQCDIPTLNNGTLYTQVSAGSHHTVLLRSDGRADACGYNENGQCGLGTTQQARHVTPLPETFSLFDQKVSKAHVFNGCEHTLVTTIDGDLSSTIGH